MKIKAKSESPPLAPFSVKFPPYSWKIAQKGDPPTLAITALKCNIVWWNFEETFRVFFIIIYLIMYYYKHSY